MDTLGNLLALLATFANEQERAQAIQQITGQTIELAFIDQGYTGDVPAEVAKQYCIKSEVTKLPEAKRGFVLL